MIRAYTSNDIKAFESKVKSRARRFGHRLGDFTTALGGARETHYRESRCLNCGALAAYEPTLNPATWRLSSWSESWLCGGRPLKGNEN